jgi:hypothetical protein
VKRIISRTAVAVSSLFLMTVGLMSVAVGPAEAVTTTTAPTSLPTISIAMNGSSITVGGALQSGAVNIVSQTINEPEGDPLLVRLNPGVSPEQLYALLNSTQGQDPNDVNPFGTIAFDAEALKGLSEVQTILQPGQYVAFDSNGQTPAKWPRTTFTVAQAAQPAVLATPQATIQAIEFAFRGPSTIHDGELVRFENGGFLVHMIVAFAVKNKKTAKQLTKLLRAGKDKRAQHLASGGVGFAGPLSSGAFQQLTVNAKPGVYVLACFMETQDGRDHTRLGMLRTIRIVG